jgi:hypothetical protein
MKRDDGGGGSKNVQNCVTSFVDDPLLTIWFVSHLLLGFTELQISNEVSDEGRTRLMKSALITHELRENAKQPDFRLNKTFIYVFCNNSN